MLHVVGFGIITQWFVIRFFCTTARHRRRKGGGYGAKAPLGLLRGGLAPPQNDITRNYLSWSGAENRDKDRDTLIEQSL